MTRYPDCPNTYDPDEWYFRVDRDGNKYPYSEIPNGVTTRSICYDEYLGWGTVDADESRHYYDKRSVAIEVAISQLRRES